MFHNANNIKKYHFKNEYFDGFNKKKYRHCIETDLELTKDEQKLLCQLLALFPHASHHDYWTTKFETLNEQMFPKKLLILAANAYDSCRNTVLAVAAEAANIKAVQRLIDMGANVNAKDLNNKLALHWAIANAQSCFDPTSYDAVKVVQCLLDNGADPTITCYMNKTPLEYAQKSGLIAAANVIALQKLSQLSFFKVKNMLKQGEITSKNIENIPNELVQKLLQS